MQMSTTALVISHSACGEEAVSASLACSSQCRQPVWLSAKARRSTRSEEKLEVQPPQQVVSQNACVEPAGLCQRARARIAGIGKWGGGRRVAAEIDMRR